MPLGPQDIAIDRKMIDYVLELVDKKLQDPDYIHNEREGSTAMPRWRVIGAGTLLDSEKNIIAATYRDAGWTEVSVRNSEDHKERPGLWCVILTAHLADLKE